MQYGVVAAELVCDCASDVVFDAVDALREIFECAYVDGYVYELLFSEGLYFFV